jgi:glycine dehydrogenase subunit 1
MTAYTPYQPEVSQGTLQTAYEFQTLICQLTGMETANLGMYDGASSMAEAALMAARVTKLDKIAVVNTVSPVYRDVLDTYVHAPGLSVASIASGQTELQEGTACVIVQQPNYYGYMEDLSALSRLAHDNNALFIVSVDPVSLGMFKPPAEYDADIVVGEGQPLGVPPTFGGPYVGLFCCKQEFVRQMPGRIVGKTVDTRGRTAYVLTLQTREQHIRRERATSNICTAVALIALMSTVYMATLGKRGMRHVAELCYHKAHYAANLIEKIPGYSLPITGTFFQEFVVECPLPPAKINERLLEDGIIGGLDVSAQVPNGMLVCVSELNSRQEIEHLASALNELGAEIGARL